MGNFWCRAENCGASEEPNYGYARESRRVVAYEAVNPRKSIHTQHTTTSNIGNIRALQTRSHGTNETRKNSQLGNHHIEDLYSTRTTQSFYGLGDESTTTATRNHPPSSKNIMAINTSVWKPDPPFDLVGEWILPSDFHGRQSFGYYKCKKCHHSWSSAHATVRYFQKCTKCNQEEYPIWMWKNSENNFKKKGKNVDYTKPHRRDLCQACRLGVCDA